MRAVADDEETQMKVLSAKPASGSNENIMALLAAQIGNNADANLSIIEPQSEASLASRDDAHEPGQVHGVGDNRNAAGGNMLVTSKGIAVPLAQCNIGIDPPIESSINRFEVSTAGPREPMRPHNHRRI